MSISFRKMMFCNRIWMSAEDLVDELTRRIDLLTPSSKDAPYVIFALKSLREEIRRGIKLTKEL